MLLRCWYLLLRRTLSSTLRSLVISCVSVPFPTLSPQRLFEVLVPWIWSLVNPSKCTSVSFTRQYHGSLVKAYFCLFAFFQDTNSTEHIQAFLQEVLTIKVIISPFNVIHKCSLRKIWDFLFSYKVFKRFCVILHFNTYTSLTLTSITPNLFSFHYMIFPK